MFSVHCGDKGTGEKGVGKVCCLSSLPAINHIPIWLKIKKKMKTSLHSTLNLPYLSDYHSPSLCY